ncbi:cyclic pyranopterin monophosphate synthase MoaC [Virgibacillus halodenitrificans]|uniref:Cyclic pyranopterin monophosphate synthase n=1 Tax=Virgibacillus halodenitrificans TaxID=1482 RepID=A0AAC9NIV7_VIRHA|nr:cyclic pyranopterin monophosphate synthase MoaC [Virgibacillus halodenitrificans]APC47122.1 molybdenum cofactor biosynthesis protein C [Virgibacillus halodenitrificans]MCG1027936.1 cyclic pyranopterin monophosphate synthase MoaC [Virgibacillus halodenitrificans]MCJ0931817.1 cyclic pyranopterin monophosphate synthase MoaC [Virgibacillus halodenitrificans]MYL59192.1 cyclic pyranopterin monophosphate synthase MoaC [Virgibacillus halodenitrificans]WHX25145.1 cyclic pyranopterin monophosphate sy
MSEFTHFNEQGRARMVDISEKKETERTAVARSSVQMSEEVYKKITQNEIKKGDVLAVAQVAGIMAAKKTSDWIPMCHPLQLKGVDISFNWQVGENYYELQIEVFVKTKGSTGVEMEALTAASASALTIYDMCKAVDKGMIIGQTYLLEKKGGKSGDYRLDERRNNNGSK